MNTFTVKIGGQQYQSVFPLKYGEFLDEQLDYSVFKLVRINRQYFAPTTPVEITITSKTSTRKKTKTLHYVVANDKFRESPLGSGQYEHEIMAIEPTKLLEGIPVETLCFTNAGGRFNYTEGIAEFIVEQQTAGISNNPNVPSPQTIDTKFSLPSLRSIVTTQFGDIVPPTGPNGYRITRLITSGGVTVTQANNIIEIPFDDYGKFKTSNLITIEGGVNTIRYHYTATYYNDTSGNALIVTEYYDATITIFGSPNTIKPLVPWTIESVINRVLELERPLVVDREGNYVVAPRFKLQLPTDTDKLALFKQVAPEFTFTRQSLREILRTIGGYIHAEPRLIYNEDTKEFDTVVFDFYGEQEYATWVDNDGNVKRLSDTAYENLTGQYGIEQACTGLDSYVDNLVNRLNSSSSVVGQPFEGGAQSFRMETSGLQYTEEGMFFPTYLPISKIHKLTAFYDGKSYDITDFVYEESIYNTQLSSHESVYPVSKMYGLYYKQDKKGIYGFFFERTNAFDQYLEKRTISNILKAVGCPFPKDAVLIDFMNLSFELVYTPIYSARIGHSKSYVGDWLNYPRTLNYAQGANQVETEYYGENIKGAVERLGTLEKQYTYTALSVDNIPKAGQLFDNDYYISTVSVECGYEKFKFTVGLSKHFNRTSQYIGVASYKRIYEVSEVMVQDRETLYKDYLVITDYDESYAHNSTIKDDCRINQTTLSQVIQTFLQDKTETLGRATHVDLYNRDKQWNSISRINLPVVSSCEGNVMSFSWGVENNFSAGQSAVPISSSYYGQDVQYADYYGRIYYEMFGLRGTLKGYEYTNNPDDFPNEIATGTMLTDFNANFGIVKRKDSRETIRTTYAIEYVTDNKDYVIGSFMTAQCPIVSGRKTRVNGIGETVPVKTYLVALNKRISKFAREIPQEHILASVELYGEVLTDDLYDEHFGVYLERLYVIRGRFTLPAFEGNAVAWAIVTESYDGKTKEYTDEDNNIIPIAEKYGHYLLFGKNAPVESGGVVDFMICPTHDIYEYLKNKQKQGE